MKFADDDIISLLKMLQIRIVEYLGGGMFKIIPQILEGEGGRVGGRESESLCTEAHPSCSAAC